MTAEASPSPDRINWQELLETALTMPGNVSAAYTRFYAYSWLNCVYLRLQGVAEPVATYKRWQSLGRQVLKGSKAKEIVRPIFIEKKNDAGEIESRITKFKPVRCIFGLSDTEGPELPPFELPEWDLPTAMQTLDIKQVPFTELDGNMQGYSLNREFALNPIAESPAKTMFHELGHIVLGHTTETGTAEYRTHRGLMEFQAESTAFLTMNELEQLTPAEASDSRGYVQHWLRDQRPPDVAIRQVFGATDKILKAGRPVVAEEVAS